MAIQEGKCSKEDKKIKKNKKIKKKNVKMIFKEC